VIETRIVERTVCPVDITAPLASRPQPADDAVVTGNTAGMAWVSAILAFLGLVEDRLRDGAEACR